MSRRSRLVALLAGLLVSLAVEGLYLWPPATLDRVDLALHDLFLAWMHDATTSNRAVIVDLDERSLSEFGRWPWPRSRLARLLAGIRDQGAAGVAVSMLFPEPDDPASDAALAEVLRSPPFVIGYAFTFTGPAGDPARCGLRAVRRFAPDEAADGIGPDGLFQATGVVCSLAAIAEAAGGSGFVNAAPDGDGIFRRVPQLLEFDGRVYPSLALAVLMQVLGTRDLTLDTGGRGAWSVRLGDRSLPLDARGNLLLHFRGGDRPFPYVSAADLLGGRLSPGSLRNKIAFVETSALGIRKLLASPLDPLLPAVEVHATIVDNVLRGDALARPRWASAVEATLVLLLGTGTAWLLGGRLSGGVALVVGLAGVLTWVATAGIFQAWAIAVSPLFPTIALAGSFAVVTLLNAASERRRAADSLRTARDLAVQVDERRRREEAAREANRAKSEFLSRMSHELRTPLNAILGFGQLLQMDASSAEQREGAEQIVRAGRHLLGLIDEVLDISRIEAGRLQLSLGPVPVGETVHRCLALVQPIARARGIELQAEGVDDRWHVKADHRRLDQVLLNILSNAVKYNREGGSVSVTIEGAADGRLRLGVHDTGHGIPPDKLPLLFTPFERLGTERSGVEGTGLGLAVSKHLVEAMGGSISVTSAPGHGSTFTVELGLADDPELQPYGDGAERRAGSSVAPVPLTVLYVEDNASNLRLVESILARRPATRLVSAPDGWGGLELAREHRPDLVLLDRHLPDVSGDDVLRQLLDDPRTKDIPVVLLSADATPEVVERLRAAGARGYLTKPLEVADLLALLDETAANKGA